jgi:thiamine transport system permease protein
MIEQRKSRSAVTLALWFLPGLFLAVFFLYPLVVVFRAALSGGFEGAEALSRVWRPLGFTVWQATLSTVLTMLVGLPAAYVFARYRFPGRALLRALTTLPFILPTVVTAAAFNAMIGPRGWVNLLLMGLLNRTEPPINLLNSLAIILLAHVFYNTAVVIRVVGSAWAQLDTRIEHAGRILGASPLRNLWEVTLPLLRPSILAAGLLVFLFDFTSFGVILLLGGPRFATLEVEIYIQAMHMLNLPLAALLSALQMAVTLILITVYFKLSGGQPAAFIPHIRNESVRPLRSWRERLLVGSLLIFLTVLLVAPLAALGLRSVTRFEANRTEIGAYESGFTLAYYREIFVNRRQSLFYVPPALAVRNSIVYGLGAAGLSLSLGMLLAYAIERSGSSARWVEPLVMLPLGTSAVTLGLGYILVFGRPPFGPQVFPLLTPIVHSLVALPVVVRSIQPAIRSVPQALRQAAAVMGAPPWRVWLEVDLPIVARAAVTGGILAFTISLGEFGATTFLTRPEYPTLPVAIYRYISQPGALNYGQALAMATMLLVVCGVSILALDKLQESNGKL